jgi:uncharacterized membrane protein YdfJ with MMPL/SSD domain
MGRILFGFGRICGRRPLIVLGVWAVAVLAVVGVVRAVGTQTSNDLDLPGTGSQAVHDLLAERFAPQQNGTNPIVFHVRTGKLTDKGNADAVTASVQALRKAPHVHSVTNPVSSDGKTAGLLSDDGRTAFAPVLLDIGSGELDETVAERVFATTKPASDAGIDVAAAGSIGSELSTEGTESSEVVGILAAMLILTFVLGSLVAMGLPILTAVLGLGIALAVVGLLGHLLSVPSTAATLATMIGLGVGIDYALFLISRHQEQLASGMPVVESIARAVATSGSAIVFAGGTVVVALVALRVAGIPLLSTLGLASAVAVVTAVLSAITLLPALLGLLQHRIRWLRLPTLRRGRSAGRGGWHAWSGFVARRPLAVTLVSLALLAPLIAPAFSLRFGQEDIGATPKSTTERQAYDLLTAGFGVGYNGPLQVASQFRPAVAPSQEYTNKLNRAQSLQQDLENDQQQLPAEQQRLEQQQQELLAQQRRLEGEQSDLEARKSRLEGEQSDLEAQGDRLQVEQQRLEGEQARIEQQGAELRGESSALRQEGAALRSQRAALERQQRRLQAQQAELERERDRLERQARGLAARIRPLARELAVTLARERVLERRIARLDGRPRRQAILQQRLDGLQIREQQLRDALAPLRDQARGLAQRARSLGAQAAALQRRADRLQGEAEELQAQAAALEEQKTALQRQAAALQRRGDRLRQQGDRLQAQAASLQRQGDALQRQADELQREGSQLQQEGNRLQQEANALQQQADQLKSEQQQAQQEKQQAEQLKQRLTAMVTKAGGDPRNTDPRVVALQDALSGTSGVATLTPPQTNKPGDVVLLSAVPTSGPATVRTADLLQTVRGDVLPEVEDDGGITSYVGGYTASYADLAALISQRLLLVIGTVVGLGFLLLMLAFRSLLVPLQAALTNVLSAAAAFGVLTAAFQWGWGIPLLGIDTASSGVPIASYVPLMMFAVLFGLSMDYEVFLVSHVQQHHLGGEPAREAAASGLASSARITTAACLIMTSVFASFVLNGDPTIKQFGVGLAGAVLLAGVLVVTLAPAAIMLMGRAAWWLPRWLDRLLPHIHLEGEEPPAAAVAPADPAPPVTPAPVPPPVAPLQVPAQRAPGEPVPPPPLTPSPAVPSAAPPGQQRSTANRGGPGARPAQASPRPAPAAPGTPARRSTATRRLPTQRPPADKETPGS